jgi:hypothetical protein
VSAIEAYRNAYAAIAGAASFGEQQTQGLSAGQYSQYFSLTPRNGKANVLGVFVKFVATLTATAAQTPVSGQDLLDLYLSGGGDIEISPGPGATMRAQTLTRAFAEFLWAESTNTAFTVSAPYTFTTSGTHSATCYIYIPVGGNAASLRIKLAGNITGVYAADVTISYTSIETDIVSSNYDGVAAFKEELTASLGSGLQSVLNYVPQTVSPDAVFMTAESSTTITAVNITTMDGAVLLNSSSTDVLQLAAAAIAPVAGATYTTDNGFVIAGDEKSFSIFQLTFASATTHYIGYFQVVGSTTPPNPSASPTSAPAAVNQTGTVTNSGGVAVATKSSTSNVASAGAKSSSRPP